MTTDQPTPPAPTFPVSENDLHTRLGLPRSWFRDVRKSGLNGLQWVRGVDWHGDNKGVFWTEKAAAEVARAVGAPEPDKAAPAPDPEVETLTVHSQPQRPLRGPGGVILRYHFGNPRIIEARRGNGELVYVRVPDSSKFTTRLVSGEPMTFLARKTSDGWLIDQRAPRWPGRW